MIQLVERFLQKYIKIVNKLTNWGVSNRSAGQRSADRMNSLSKTDDFIKMINSLSKTDDSIKSHKYS